MYNSFTDNFNVMALKNAGKCLPPSFGLKACTLFCIINNVLAHNPMPAPVRTTDGFVIHVFGKLRNLMNLTNVWFCCLNFTLEILKFVHSFLRRQRLICTNFWNLKDCVRILPNKAAIAVVNQSQVVKFHEITPGTNSSLPPPCWSPLVEFGCQSKPNGWDRSGSKIRVHFDHLKNPLLFVRLWLCSKMLSKFHVSQHPHSAA